MSTLQRLKRPLVWLRRIRHRKGYGVHSPFAFDLITSVIYEKTPYYAYSTLPCHKTGRLLFRLVNRVQPQVIADISHSHRWQTCMQSAKPSAAYHCISPHQVLDNQSIDFVYIHTDGDAVLTESTFREHINYVLPRSVCVIEGIHTNGEMKRAWQQIIRDERVIVSFDLYDVGIIYFDQKKIKQHYIVNF